MNANSFRKRFRKEIDLCKPAIDLVKYVIHPKEHESRHNYGIENPDKTIYIIRPSNPKAGMFSLLNTVLQKTMYALDRGYHPVVDMRNYPNSYLSDSAMGFENSWEYFFEPLTDDMISLDDAYSSKNVILSSLYAKEKGYYFDAHISLSTGSDEYIKIKKSFDEHIRIKQKLIERYDTICSELLGNKKVVGVLCRGTDYTSLKPYAHPIQPEVSDVIDKAEEFLSGHGCTHIYLCTEDEKIVRLFEERFGDRLLVYPRRYVSESTSGEVITDIINKACNPEDAGIDYLGQIYVLAKCRFGILSLTSATPFVSFMSEFEDIHIWNLGRYGYDD